MLASNKQRSTTSYMAARLGIKYLSRSTNLGQCRGMVDCCGTWDQAFGTDWPSFAINLWCYFDLNEYQAFEAGDVPGDPGPNAEVGNDLRF